jgi:uncharacterized membrane protein (DUF2068 family)
VAWPREIRVRYFVFTYTEAKGLWRVKRWDEAQLIV